MESHQTYTSLLKILQIYNLGNNSIAIVIKYDTVKIYRNVQRFIFNMKVNNFIMILAR